jgi:hypothetical protein
MVETKDEKEVKRENFDTVEEALEGAGSRVLSHLPSPAHKLTREEVTQFEEENPQEIIAYAGPYTDEEDQRNSWTAVQDAPPEAPLGTAAERREKQQETQRRQEQDQREEERKRLDEQRRRNENRQNPSA